MIAVDSQVRAPDNKAYDVLFIGTGENFLCLFFVFLFKTQNLKAYKYFDLL